MPVPSRVVDSPVDDPPPLPVPAGLGLAGAALWERMTAAFVIEQSAEAELLEQACRQRDAVAALEDFVSESGLLSVGAKGQPRLSAAVAELRQARLALARLLGELALPGEGTARSRRAQRAARARWSGRAGA